jgi:hypothetical protein
MRLNIVKSKNAEQLYIIKSYRKEDGKSTSKNKSIHDFRKSAHLYLCSHLVYFHARFIPIHSGV